MPLIEANKKRLPDFYCKQKIFKPVLWMIMLIRAFIVRRVRAPNYIPESYF